VGSDSVWSLATPDSLPPSLVHLSPSHPTVQTGEEQEVGQEKHKEENTKFRQVGQELDQEEQEFGEFPLNFSPDAPLASKY
jgi:hypothetical protein